MTLKPILLSLSLMLIAACSGPDKPAENASEKNVTDTDAVVNIYSSRHYDTDLRLYSDFTEQTGIEVNRIEAKSSALIERLKSEGEFSPADLLITVDAGQFWRAGEAGLLQPISSDVLETRIPAHLRHPEGLWYGLTKRARVIIYNKEQGRPQNLAAYADLARPEHKGKVCMRSSGNIYNISLLASIVSHQGQAAAQSWAAGMVDNFARKPQSNDSGQIEAVAAGICGISLVNSYYLARYARADDTGKQDIFNRIGIIFPNQNDRGAHINISGAAVTAHAPNRENAVKFMEYLTSETAQSYFANGNNEYPVIDLSVESSAVQSLGRFKEDALSISELGEKQSLAISIYNGADWP